jgi:hypothetical protein
VEIDKALNFVFPIRYVEVEKTDPKDSTKKVTEREPSVWAYVTPIDYNVFRANYRVIVAAKNELDKIGPRNALPVAVDALLDAAREDAIGRDTEDTGPALLAEIMRQTTILAPGPKGFEYLPADAAIARKIISENDWHDGECVIVFFTCNFLVAMRSRRAQMAGLLAKMFNGSITSSPPTEFVASLPTSTPAATSEVPVTAPVPPPPNGAMRIDPSLVPS